MKIAIELIKIFRKLILLNYNFPHRCQERVLIIVIKIAFNKRLLSCVWINFLTKAQILRQSKIKIRILVLSKGIVN